MKYGHGYSLLIFFIRNGGRYLDNQFGTLRKYIKQERNLYFFLTNLQMEEVKVKIRIKSSIYNT